MVDTMPALVNHRFVLFKAASRQSRLPSYDVVQAMAGRTAPKLFYFADRSAYLYVDQALPFVAFLWRVMSMVP